MSRAWMPLFVADYLADTRHLGALEHGAYLLLIMHYWQTGSLPNDDRQLARIAATSPDEWATVRDTVGNFFEQPGWKHPRIDGEIARAQELGKVKASAGRAGARQKWGGDGDKGQTRSKRLTEARSRGSHTAEQWDAMLELCEFGCVRCGSSGPIVKDHILPIYKGGSDAIDNLQPLCLSCNSGKGPESTDHRPIGWEKRLTERLAERLAPNTFCQAQVDPLSPSHSPLPLQSQPQSQNRSDNLGKEGEAGADRAGPCHGAHSKARQTVYFRKGTDEWKQYAEDYKSAHGVEPAADRHGGRWFKILGEHAVSRRA